MNNTHICGERIPSVAPNRDTDCEPFPGFFATQELGSCVVEDFDVSEV
jgi:hypothetical protein